MTDLNWTSRFDGLAKLDPKTRDYLAANSKVVKVPAKTTIFGPGKSPQNTLFLLDGTVRVQQSSDSGHEIVLYRIHAGKSCVLTTACLLAYEDYSAEGISKTDVSAAAIPRKVFDELVATSDGFRNFVFAAFSKRITNLFLMIDEVAFQRLDVRLAHKLVELAAGADTIAATHQNLAAELGTAREVISRQLQEFQRRGWIEQSRGKIAILQRKGLENLAQRNT